MSARCAGFVLLGIVVASCARASGPPPRPTRTAERARTNEPARPPPAAEPRPSEECQQKECVGAPEPMLIQELGLVAAETRRCYERALRSDPNLEGRVGVEIEIAESGKPCRVTFRDPTLEMDAAFQACVKQVFDRTYPAPKGGCMNAVVPLNFKIKDAGADGAPQTGVARRARACHS